MKTRRGALGSLLALGAAALGAAACDGASGPQPVSSGICNSRFQVVNQSGRTIERLYFSHSSLGSWGADQLGRNVLPSGRLMTFRAANAGDYDFRVVWTDGRSAELRGVNVCVASRVTATRNGLYAS